MATPHAVGEFLRIGPVDLILSTLADEAALLKRRPDLRSWDRRTLSIAGGVTIWTPPPAPQRD